MAQAREKVTDKPLSPLGKYISKLLSEHDLSANQFAQRCKLSRGTVHDAMHDTHESSTGTLKKLADGISFLTGEAITIDFLIGLQRQPIEQPKPVEVKNLSERSNSDIFLLGFRDRLLELCVSIDTYLICEGLLMPCRFRAYISQLLRDSNVDIFNSDRLVELIRLNAPDPTDEQDIYLIRNVFQGIQNPGAIDLAAIAFTLSGITRRTITEKALRDLLQEPCDAASNSHLEIR